LKQGNPRGTIRIILDIENLSGHPSFLASKVNEAIHPLMAASMMATGKGTLGISPPTLGEGNQQALVGNPIGDLLEGGDALESSAGRCRF
jgi:hypothetical protein